jgi:serine/threonine protein kinase
MQHGCPSGGTLVGVSVAARDPPPRPPPVGSLGVFGGYELVRELGHGGMAEVFLAHPCDAPERLLVIKRMLPHISASRRNVELFLREARLAARLDHPNVVHVYELGQDSGTHFLALEYIDGVNLHRLAKETWRAGRSLPTEVVVRAIADAALGLHHAHTLVDARGQPAGLVHRDISPENLMVGRDGVTRVLDFGIARTTEPGHTVTETGELKGKIPYMSPEQIEGKPLDGRSDLFSLGVTLYWLLCGRRPFDGVNEVATIRNIADGRWEPASRHNPLTPRCLDDVLARLLARDPAERIASGEALHGALVEMLGARRDDRSEAQRLVVEVHHTPPPEDEDQAEQFTALVTNQRVLRPSRPASRPMSASFTVTSLTGRPSLSPRRPMASALAAGTFGATGLFVLAAVVAFDHDAAPPDVPPAAHLAPAVPATVTVTVTVRSTPSARVFVDGVFIPGEPASIHVAREPETVHQVRVEADGYEPATFDFVASADVERDVALVPLPIAVPAIPAASPPKSRPSMKKPASCGLPFLIDARGIKTYKPECL